MTRCAVSALAVALLALPPVASPALADCVDWDSMERTDRGTLRGLPPGAVRWRVGLRSAGWSHQSTSVEVAWTAQDGQVWRQTLFEEIQQGRPSLRVRRGRLELRITYCERGGGCRGVTLPYTWSHASRRFTGATRDARESLAVSCTPVPVPADS
ncbi:hypothetical protein GXW78_06535 [Roseomonas terrae]|uniref:Uncharacterized protein n=1 Tax=Neoroseomonas terrae TaxID=424799 RepID=A0ABS5EE64_9PROT|nr:hypothetical protein [Neoroseomonas terrae]MBR0649311.1 hypothetical protein [Neoroseomonas terrae]